MDGWNPKDVAGTLEACWGLIVRIVGQVIPEPWNERLLIALVLSFLAILVLHLAIKYVVNPLRRKE